MRNLVQKVAALSLMLALPFSANANDLPFKSAEMAFEGEDLLTAVTVNNVSESDVLYCRADINVEGQAERANCFAKKASPELVIDTEEALKTLEFSAAEVEGSAVPVRMSFRVAFTKLGDETVVTLIPNLGTMQAKFGRDYVAPQERLDISDWYERYSDNSLVGGKEFLGNGELARVSAVVDQKGAPSRLKSKADKRAHVRDANVVKNTLKHSRFIPGTSNGKVVPMEYVVTVHYEDANQAYANAK